MDSSFESSVLDFIKNVNVSTADMSGTVGTISESLAAASERIKLGRAYFSMLSSESDEIETELFSDASGYDVQKVSIGRLSDGGDFSVTLMPKKGYKWSEEEADAVMLIAKTCFIMLSEARASENAESLGFIDRMTGAANTDGFTSYVNMLASSGELVDYTAAFMNIKNFKYVNKVFGSSQGDRLLKSFSDAMRDFVGDEGKFARLGGDNFIVLIKKGLVSDLRTFVDTLSFEMGEGETRQLYDLRLRMGIYDARSNDTVSDMMNNSSIAHVSAKNDKLNDIVYFSPALLEQSNHKKKISTLFPKALENREFAVYYQPKVDLTSNKLCGCEALSRWIRDGRIVPPMEFIPVLESEGTICMLDFYVLEQVCKDIKGWLESGIEPVKVSVNFSKHHLHNKRLANRILGIIRKHGIDGKYLEVELTEMTGYDDLTAMRAFVDEMKANNIATSIDDFGTGYSSLNLLKELDVDVIKLDKSFFSNISENEDVQSTDRIVVKNIVNMVNELDMETISEGVETKSQADFLRNICCNMAQGFLFDRPLPKEEFDKRLSDGNFYSDKG